jgi:hypothetical protein
MGMIGRIVGGALAAKLLHRAIASKQDTTQGGQYLPANQADTPPAQSGWRGNGMVEKAGRFYRENPKLVHSIGSAALAIALASYAQRRRRI